MCERWRWAPISWWCIRGRGNKPAGPVGAGDSLAQALRQAARGIRFGTGPFHELHRGGLRILIENTSGMGSAIGVRFEELRAILDGAKDVPLGVCLDTAHAFEAGYDIRSESGLRRTIAAFDRIVGLWRLAVVHVNDSKTPFGSRVDRHQHIGHGAIGREAFGRVLRHARLSVRALPRAARVLPGRAFILETPIDAPGDDRRNVRRRLWELAAGRGCAVGAGGRGGLQHAARVRAPRQVPQRSPGKIKSAAPPAKAEALRRKP